MTTMSTINSAIFRLVAYIGCGSSLAFPPDYNHPVVHSQVEILKPVSLLGLDDLRAAGGVKRSSVDCRIPSAEIMATMSTINSVISA
jgi:hypothetical protein